jgi:hypothetical protein
MFVALNNKIIKMGILNYIIFKSKHYFYAHTGAVI